LAGSTGKPLSGLPLVIDRGAAGLTAFARGVELVLAAGVVVGVMAAMIGGARDVMALDWTQPVAFERLMSRVLLVAIGLELVRLLVVHSLPAMIELMAFAVARQMLAPGISARDLAVGAATFIALLAAERYLLPAAALPRPEPDPPASAS